MSILLSNRAQVDLDSIRNYTIKNWSEFQWFTYYQGLVEVFEKISDEPASGQNRDVFYPGLRSLLYKQHIIFFIAPTSTHTQSVIVRIFHQKQSLASIRYSEGLI